MANMKDFGFKEEELGEEAIGTWEKTNWPKTVSGVMPGQTYRWRLVYEIYNQSIEDMYFRAVDYMQEEENIAKFIKITDIFAASEQSAFFGVAQQRIGLQQDKVSQFLAIIGKMVKELFQLVREIRILDERLEYYNGSYKGDKAAEITLKGYWIDLVEGGAKNPASVYGMARELGFTTLPDLFFEAPPMDPDNVSAYVEKLDFNRKVKEVLMRKLKTYLIWKKHTFKELKDRRIFTIRFLRQHYDIIKMYMNWVKPYLRNIQRMHMDQTKMDTVHLINAFEGAMVEIEFLAVKKFNDFSNCVFSLHFDFRTRPEMKFVQEGYNRGPSHVGRTVFTVRPYVWTSGQIKRYRKFREKEDFELLASVDASVKAAYTALGDELEKYLAEAGENTVDDFGERKEAEKKREGILDPFIAIFRNPAKEAAKEGKKEGITTCKKCEKENNVKNYECEHCGYELRKLTREEANEQHKGNEKANEFWEKHTYNFIKRYKAAYGFIY